MPSGRTMADRRRERAATRRASCVDGRQPESTRCSSIPPSMAAGRAARCVAPCAGAALPRRRCYASRPPTHAGVCGCVPYESFRTCAELSRVFALAAIADPRFPTCHARKPQPIRAFVLNDGTGIAAAEARQRSRTAAPAPARISAAAQASTIASRAIVRAVADGAAGEGDGLAHGRKSPPQR